MTSDKMVLLCNPDEPGWINASASVRSIGDCGHPIVISAAGVGLVLTTPGLSPICMRCIPADEELEFRIAPEIAAQFKEETGLDITPGFQNRMTEWAERFRRQ